MLADATADAMLGICANLVPFSTHSCSRPRCRPVLASLPNSQVAPATRIMLRRREKSKQIVDGHILHGENGFDFIWD